MFLVLAAPDTLFVFFKEAPPEGAFSGLRMKIFRLFNNAAEKEFARDLVERLLKELPPKLMEQHHKVLSVNKITRLLERNGQLATAYHQENGLGVVKRAVLANNYKWLLKNSGYPDDFVSVATESLVVALTKAANMHKTKA